MSRFRSRWLVLGVLALAAGACKRRRDRVQGGTGAAVVASGDGRTISCPAAEALARIVKEEGRVARTDCLVYEGGGYWMAAALRYAPKTFADPRLFLVFGVPWNRQILTYDVEPAPTAALASLLGASRDAEVRIRRGRSGPLVRIGVVGRTGDAKRPGSQEVIVLLQLAAHAAPKLVWTGHGDQTTTSADGCVNERFITFETLFSRVEMTTAYRARPATGGSAACGAGPATQESLAVGRVQLRPPRRSSFDKL